MHALWANPCLKHAWLIFCAERNTGHESGFLARYFLSLGSKKLCAIAEREDGDYGWWTTGVSKPEYGYAARFQMINRSVCYMKDFVCANPWLKSNERRQITKTKFEEQMRRYGPVEIAPKTALSTSRVGISGKVDKDGKISKMHTDDLMMVFTMAMHIWNRLLEKKVPNINYNEIFGQ